MYVYLPSFVGEMNTIYTMCAFDTAIRPDESSQWCDLFTLEESKVLEYCRDIKVSY